MHQNLVSPSLLSAKPVKGFPAELSQQAGKIGLKAQSRMRIKLTILLSALLLAAEAQASGGMSVATNTNAKWKVECSACHVAYPAQLLPASSWDAIMKNLDKHFGSDASVDAASTTEIMAYLQANASRRKFETSTKPPLRITETRWFQNQHDEVPARLWKDPRVKSASNCAACHTKADSGDFNEHAVRLPR